MYYTELKRNDKIALIGGARIPEEIIPWEDTSIDKMLVGYAGWGLHQSYADDFSLEYNWMHKYEDDLYLIDIHTRHTRKPEYIEWLKSMEFRVLMQVSYPDIPGSIEFPLTALQEKFGRDYYMSSFAYMVAWSIYMGYKEIHLFNIAMVYDDDLIQRYNFEYWLGRAEQAGIKVITSKQCDLLKCYNYGYDVDNTLGVYMQKYLFSLRYSTLKGIESSIEMLNRAKSAFELSCMEATKFNKEILTRHGLNAINNNVERDW